MNNYSSYVRNAIRKKTWKKVLNIILGIILLPFQVLLLIIWETPQILFKKIYKVCKIEKTITQKNVEQIYEALMDIQSYAGETGYLYISTKRHHDYLDFALSMVILGDKSSEYLDNINIQYEKNDNGKWMSKSHTLFLLLEELKKDSSLKVSRVIGIEGCNKFRLKHEGILLNEEDYKKGEDKKFLSRLLIGSDLYKVEVTDNINITKLQKNFR